MAKIDSDYLNSGYTYRGVQLISGDYRVMPIGAILGYCHCNAHKGFITKNLYKSHACEAKKCVHLERFDDYPYWRNRKKAEQEKLYQKELLQKKKAKQQEQKEALHKHLTDLTHDADKLLRKWGYSIVVTSIKMTAIKEYTIFYVSNNKENDWIRYIKLARILSALYDARFTLTRVIMPDGNFATIKDWERIHG